MRHAPQVSIVLPTYNGTKYIRDAIDSILSQTFKDFELIIVDDCSTDGVKDVISFYTDPRIVYIRNEKNLRLPNSLNVGFKASRGSYLTWTSDDNYYASTAIEEMITYLKNNQADFVYCDLYNVYINEGGAIKERKLQDAERMKVEDCVGACFLYSRRAYEAVGDYNADAELVEDYEYWVRIWQYYPLHHIKKSLYYYRYHDLSLWGTKYGQIQIMDFLMKLKFDFLNKSEVNWGLRGLKLEAKKDFSITHKIINRLFYKGKIDAVLNEFLSEQIGYKETRSRLSFLIFGRLDDVKHFVFLRKFSPDWEWGGTEQLLVDWFERCHYSRCRITLAVPSGSKMIFEKKLAGKSCRVTVVEMPFSLRTNVWQRFRLMFGFLFSLKPDTVIFVHGWYGDFRCAEFIAAWWSAKGRVYLHENSVPPPPPEKSGNGLGLWRHLQKFFVFSKTYFCKKVLTVSQDVGDKLATFWGYPRNKLKTAYHGTDTQKFSPSTEIAREMRKNLGIKDSDIVIIVLSRLSPEKNVERVIEAFDNAASNMSNVLLLIAGRGPLESELKDLAKIKRSSDRIRFLGPVDNASDILKMSDIYISSSDMEGFGISLVEAMATGLISIATASSGPLEIIEDGVNGFLTAPNSNAIVTALEMVFQLKAAEKKMVSEAARTTVVERFDVERNTRISLEMLTVPSKV